MLHFLDYFGVVIFAMTGCLVAARRDVDVVGFIWLAVVTAIGGGTLRDLILDRPIFWVTEPFYLVLCLITAIIMFFVAHTIHRRMSVVLWCDAIGLAVFAVIGTQIAITEHAHPLVVILMGVLTATFGGVLRDLLAGEPTLILRREIYVTAAALSSCTYLACTSIGIGDPVSVPLACFAGFGLRALALFYNLSLPGHTLFIRHKG